MSEPASEQNFSGDPIFDDDYYDEDDFEEASEIDDGLFKGGDESLYDTKSSSDYNDRKSPERRSPLIKSAGRNRSPPINNPEPTKKFSRTTSYASSFQPSPRIDSARSSNDSGINQNIAGIIIEEEEPTLTTSSGEIIESEQQETATGFLEVKKTDSSSFLVSAPESDIYGIELRSVSDSETKTNSVEDKSGEIDSVETKERASSPINIMKSPRPSPIPPPPDRPKASWGFGKQYMAENDYDSDLGIDPRRIVPMNHGKLNFSSVIYDFVMK